MDDKLAITLRPGARNIRGVQVAPPALGQIGTDHGTSTLAVNLPVYQKPNGVEPVTAPSNVKYSSNRFVQTNNDRYDFNSKKAVETTKQSNAVVSGSTYVVNNTGTTADQQPVESQTRIISTPAGDVEVIVNS